MFLSSSKFIVRFCHSFSRFQRRPGTHRLRNSSGNRFHRCRNHLGGKRYGERNYHRCEFTGDGSHWFDCWNSRLPLSCRCNCSCCYSIVYKNSYEKNGSGAPSRLTCTVSGTVSLYIERLESELCSENLHRKRGNSCWLFVLFLEDYYGYGHDYSHSNGSNSVESLWGEVECPYSCWFWRRCLRWIWGRRRSWSRCRCNYWCGSRCWSRASCR